MANRSIDELLKDVKSLNVNPDILKVIDRFLQHEALGTDGIIIIYTQGKHVRIDGSKFSEPEAVWALQKAIHNIIEKGVPFGD